MLASKIAFLNRLDSVQDLPDEFSNVFEQSSQQPTFSLFIETENLAGSANFNSLHRCLKSIEKQDFPLREAENLYLLCSPEDQDKAAQIQSGYPWLQLKVYSPSSKQLSSNYYHCKNVVGQQCESEVLIFLDSDCSYSAETVSSLLETFRTYPKIHVLSGQTQTHCVTPYEVAMTLSFSFGQWSPRRDLFLRPGRSYVANLVAFRRNAFQEVPLPSDLPFYRRGCVEHSKLLRSAGYEIVVQGSARGTHPTPELPEFMGRFFLIGQDLHSYWVRDNHLDNLSFISGARVAANAILYRLKRFVRRFLRLAISDPGLIGQAVLGSPYSVAAETAAVAGVLKSWLTPKREQAPARERASNSGVETPFG